VGSASSSGDSQFESGFIFLSDIFLLQLVGQQENVGQENEG